MLIESLGRNDTLLTVDDGRGHRRDLRLSPRHSEILLLLASAPRGLSGDELAVLLYEEDSSASTLRVEMGRLRSLLGDDLLASRPYRLVAELAGDWLGVEAHLAAGDVASAHARLPRPAPAALGRARESCACARASRATCAGPSCGSGRADLMSAWTRSASGRRRLRDVAGAGRLLGPGSPSCRSSRTRSTASTASSARLTMSSAPCPAAWAPVEGGTACVWPATQRGCNVALPTRPANPSQAAPPRMLGEQP